MPILYGQAAPVGRLMSFYVILYNIAQSNEL